MSQNANKCSLLFSKPGKNIAFHLQCTLKIIQFPVVKSQSPTIPSDISDISTMAQMVHFFTSIRILNSEFRILNSEFRISKKNVVYRNFVFGDDTSGSVHGVGPFDPKLEQFKQ